MLKQPRNAFAFSLFTAIAIAFHMKKIKVASARFLIQWLFSVPTRHDIRLQHSAKCKHDKTREKNKFEFKFYKMTEEEDNKKKCLFFAQKLCTRKFSDLECKYLEQLLLAQCMHVAELINIEPNFVFICSCSSTTCVNIWQKL